MTTADLILGAELTLATFSALPTPRQIEAYPVLGDWSSSTLTWNNKPPYDGAEALDYQFVSGSSGSVFSWDITKLVKSWYATGINRGLMLKNAREYTSADYADFHSSDTSYGAPYRPQITLAYVNQSGLEGYWSYHAQDLGRAGTAYVQDHSGNVVL
ncbi:DNRLRE domain-containing protein, partial [Proteiniclasticum sediminis]|uniref:DNRLRE domain-containing protein n=1 Tax=Proteiniclasticum sediminis TaxID=2804028 RepID=UPI001E28C781